MVHDPGMIPPFLFWRRACNLTIIIHWYYVSSKVYMMVSAGEHRQAQTNGQTLLPPRSVWGSTKSTAPPAARSNRATRRPVGPSHRLVDPPPADREAVASAPPPCGLPREARYQENIVYTIKKTIFLRKNHDVFQHVFWT